LSTLIESVTIYPDGEHGPEAEVVAKVSALLVWATDDNAAREGGVVVLALVAGTGSFSTRKQVHPIDISMHYYRKPFRYPYRL
jgi:hypothetical protein